jgi:outer membrane lipoprotein SlyB
MNAKHALTVAAAAAGFAAAVPASAQTYYHAPSAPAQAPSYAYPAAASEVGTVQSVEVVANRSPASGAGAVIGGIAGGLVGSQIGSGSGNAAATIGGALGGAYLGNELERRRTIDETYRFNVRMDDGSARTFMQDTPEIRVGSRVRVTDSGQIILS